MPDRLRAVLGMGASAYPLHTPQPGWAEQAPEDWWQAAIVAVRQALASAARLTGELVEGVLVLQSCEPNRRALAKP